MSSQNPYGDNEPEDASHQYLDLVLVIFAAIALMFVVTLFVAPMLGSRM